MNADDCTIDLGGGWRAGIERDAGGEPIWVHLLGPGPLGGGIPVSRKGGSASPPVWHLVSEDPLTLLPSIDFVGRVGGHGHITGGKWVPV